jgi:3-hydroxyacyl-CoA dehydrogenase/3a,7a,12a-trihydroxy-5b-cholest-24-enoyl-CoA hydratase
VYLFKINGGKDWTVDLKNGSGSVKEGAHGKPDCTVTISEDDFVNLITGKANGQQLFMGGKLKISGNMAMAMKLEVLKTMAPKEGFAASAAGGEVFASDVVFPEIDKRIKEDQSLLKKINGVYRFNITGNGTTKTWTVDVKNAPGGAVEGEQGKADCTITVSDEDYVNLITGKANGQQLFMGGKLKISGNMAMAMKLEVLKTMAPKEGFAASAAGGEVFASDVVFPEIDKRIKEDQSLLKKINGVYRFNITGNGTTKTWTVDVKNAPGGAVEGEQGKADCTITVSDEDYVNLITGKANGQQLFMGGKLKISGNMAMAMKLEVLKTMAPKEGFAASAAGGEVFASDVVFPEIDKRIKEDQSLLKKINGVYRFNITGNGTTKTWTVDVKNAPGGAVEGEQGKADCTITVSDEDYVNLITGKANGQQLFMGGKLKISGNMAMAMKLEVLKTMAPKEGFAASAAGGEVFASDVVFPEIDKRIKEDQSLLKKINGVYRFNITGNGTTKTWTVDVKNAPGGAVEGEQGKADCTITVSDEDYVNLITGKANGQQLFMGGKLKISGNMAMAMKLSQLSAPNASL